MYTLRTACEASSISFTLHAVPLGQHFDLAIAWRKQNAAQIHSIDFGTPCRSMGNPVEDQVRQMVCPSMPGELNMRAAS